MGKVQLTKEGHIVNVHRVRIKLITGDEICGIVNIADYDCERLSDFFALDSRSYIIMNKCDNEHKTMFINRDHIVWAVPANE